MSKHTTLDQLKMLAQRTKAEIDQVESKSLVGIKVNGTALSIADKMVDILIATGTANGTVAVNGVDVAVKGLAALAYKAGKTTHGEKTNDVPCRSCKNYPP